jgi:hypothetical protein
LLNQFQLQTPVRKLSMLGALVEDSEVQVHNLFLIKFIQVIRKILAANAGSQTFNAGGPGGGFGASAANAGGKNFTIYLSFFS